ncbi:MAG TPA: EAL domain-containing protein [Thermoanaerobaculaceae bacterium]|nr:EAL domain-containing protein [Thermoanaerobaculaceae bacterium]
MSDVRPVGFDVLLVDDDRHSRRNLEEALRARGHAVTACVDLDAAWSAFDAKRQPLLLVAADLLRADAGGICGRIRAGHGGRRTVVVAIAPRQSASPAESLLDATDDCLVKPATPEAIAVRLAIAERLVRERAREHAVERDTTAADGSEGARADAGAPDPRSDHETGGEAASGTDPGGGAASSPRAAGTALSVTTDSPLPTVLSLSEAGERGIADGWWDWDLASGKVVFSSQWKAMLGYAPDELAGGIDEWFSRVHPEDLAQLRAGIAAHLAGRASHLENEHRLRLRDGTYGCMLCRAMAFRDRTDTPFRIVGSHRDITELKNRDPLTGLPNRGFLIERLGHALEQTGKAGSRSFAVLFLDLDRFKNVNYSLGHRVGDQLLKAVAGRLRASLRSQDAPHRFGNAVVHIGGDEFAVLLEGLAEASDATRIAKRILAELQAPFSVEGHEIFSSASIGIAYGSTHYERPEDILRDADTAMYRAKAQGKASFAVFDDAMHAGAVSLLKLETELRRAVKREEFLVHYQPIVLLDGGRITGFEALVRWQHPDRGLLLPAEFLPVAEETGLIVDIDRLVLRAACRQLRIWNQQARADAPVTVSVNVSGVQFLRPDMMVEIDRTLRTYGVWGRSLKLEITESVIMEHARYAADMLQQLKGLDVKLSIDDFGTGYSSLSYLRRFEIDTLKIDHSFISRIDTDPESWEIVRTIVTLGNNLGKEVVAEGIETRKQRDRLLSLRCGYGQGELFSKPVPADEATALLAAGVRGEALSKA